MSDVEEAVTRAHHDECGRVVAALTEARRTARVSVSGELVTLDEQDRRA